MGKQETIRVAEMADMRFYTLGSTTLRFRRGEGAPQLVFGDQLVTIDQPERFGRWGTAAQRREYIRKFVASQAGK